ncbi:MAG: glycoside hydrolase family 3 C-terminal domain-containing protein [Bacteroidia bacterium]|nr:glycoside hydrolase family 3 C-terminal domain-containing protein [Bacteroidia bacterium]
MKRIIISSVLCVSFLVAGTPQNTSTPKLGKDPVKKVIAAMTLEEKAALVVGTGMRMPGGPPPSASANPSVNPPVNPPSGLVIGQTESLVAGASGTSFALPRLGITPMVLADGPAGLRIDPDRANDKNTYYCTAFPVATLLAFTWDTELVNKVGQAMGNEVLEYGADILLGPGINIHRNPLCGRNFEYYSEDPFVTGKIAAAMINGVESEGVGTSVKHFAANNAETNRNSLNTLISERALREIYLEGFRIAVQEAQPWTVMSSYNLINGVYASQSSDLLTNILRKDWGFKGFVMTDWFGGKDPVAQMIAGNDMLMPGTPNQIQAIIKAVQEGKLDVSILDRNVERILNIILQSPRFKGYKYSNKPDLKAHAQITRQAASEGMVLLKNTNGSLPFGSNIKNIAAFGNTSYEIITGGTGSGDVNEAYSISLIDGLQNAGYKLNEDLHALYANYLKLTKAGRPQMTGFMAMMGSKPIEELILNQDIINGMVNLSDAAIITIGRNSGEGSDHINIKGDFQLSDSEQQLIKMVSTAFQAKGEKVIVILNVGSVVETDSWRDLPDVILLAWQAGQETGNSIADILCGKVNPSGKIATTFPVNYEDVPSAKTFPGKELQTDQSAGQGQTGGFGRSKPAVVTYEDGIYVGYRYYETFKVKPAYEFGYGLSYTSFTYSNIKLSSPKFSGNLSVSVDIKNSGPVAGKEVVELYLSAPALKLNKPVLELKGFAKTRLLQPGESQTLTFIISSHNLSSFDPASSSWIAEAGKYEVMIGASSRNIRQSASFSLAKDLTIKKESVSLVPKEKINELKHAK